MNRAQLAGLCWFAVLALGAADEEEEEEESNCEDGITEFACIKDHMWSVFMMQTGIILLSFFFEKSHSFLMAHLTKPENRRLKSVFDNLFAEMMILGFVGLVFFILHQTGATGFVAEMEGMEEEEYEEFQELVHYNIFLLMCFFFGIAGWLIVASSCKCACWVWRFIPSQRKLLKKRQEVLGDEDVQKHLDEAFQFFLAGITEIKGWQWILFIVFTGGWSAVIEVASHGDEETAVTYFTVLGVVLMCIDVLAVILLSQVCAKALKATDFFKRSVDQHGHELVKIEVEAEVEEYILKEHQEIFPGGKPEHFINVLMFQLLAHALYLDLFVVLFGHEVHDHWEIGGVLGVAALALVGPVFCMPVLLAMLALLIEPVDRTELEEETEGQEGTPRTPGRRHPEAKQAYEESIQYSKGLNGFPQDHFKAVELLRKASSLGHEEANQVLQTFDALHGKEGQQEGTL